MGVRTVIERDEVDDAAHRLANAVGRRDIPAIESLLAPGFIHRTHAGAAMTAGEFAAAIRQIPGDILSIAIEQLEIDLTPGGALVTGTQHARVTVDGEVLDDRSSFAD